MERQTCSFHLLDSFTSVYLVLHAVTPSHPDLFPRRTFQTLMDRRFSWVYPPCILAQPLQIWLSFAVLPVCSHAIPGLLGFSPSLCHCKAQLTHYFCHLDMSGRLCSHLCGVDRSQGRLSVLISWTSSALISAAGVSASHFDHADFTCAV